MDVFLVKYWTAKDTTMYLSKNHNISEPKYFCCLKRTTHGSQGANKSAHSVCLLSTPNSALLLGSCSDFSYTRKEIKHCQGEKNPAFIFSSQIGKTFFYI